MNTGDIPEETMNHILDCIYSGRKIEAVRHYKDVRKSSLRESKEFIESLTAELREQSPEKFNSMAKPGCLGVMMIVLVSLSLFAISV